MYSIFLLLTLIAQPGADQFFGKVTPGLGGNFLAEPALFLDTKRINLSLDVVSSPFPLYPYTSRALFPAGAVHLNYGLNDKMNIRTKLGLYLKNRTRTPRPFYGAGLRFKFLQYHIIKKVFLDLAYVQLNNLQFFSQDPNITVRYENINHIAGKFMLETSGLNINITLSLGLQYYKISGSYWQEAEPNYTKYEYNTDKIYLLGTLSLMRRFNRFGLGLNTFLSHDIPGFSLEFLFIK